MANPRYYSNFDPRNFSYASNNPYMQQQYQNAQLDIARANADLAQYKAENAMYSRSPLLNIAKMFADRYNKRGIYKGNGYLTDFFNNYGKPAPQVEGAIKPKEGQAPETNVPPAEAVAGGIGAGVNLPSATEQAKLENKAAYLDKFRGPDTANPNGDAITVKNNVSNLDKLGDQIDFSKVDRSTLYRQAEEMLKERGLTNYQRGQVLANFDNIYNEKLGRYNENKVTDLIGKGQEAARQGKWDEAQNYFMSAGMINPRAGAMYMQGLNASYNRNMAERRMAMAAAKGSGGPRGGGLVPGVYGDGKNGYFAMGDNGQMFATDAYGNFKPINVKIGGSRFTPKQVEMAQKVLADPMIPDANKEYEREIVNEFMHSQAPVEYNIASQDGLMRAMEDINNRGLTYQDEQREFHRVGLDKSPLWNRANDFYIKNRYYTKGETNNDRDDFDPNEDPSKIQLNRI